jgi:hypothetical protein
MEGELCAYGVVRYPYFLSEQRGQGRVDRLGIRHVDIVCAVFDQNEALGIGHAGCDRLAQRRRKRCVRGTVQHERRRRYLPQAALDIISLDEGAEG